MSKVQQLSSLKNFVREGNSVALGGAWLANKPMAAVREIIRQKINRLTVLTVTGSLEVDLLIGAGAVDQLVFAFTSLDAFGLAPNFRKAVEGGTVKLKEISGLAFILGLEAQGRGVPYLPYRGPFGSDYFKIQPDYYRTVRCPFTDEELVAVPAMQPDVAIIHAARADETGNAQVLGHSGIDTDLVRAAKTVVVTTEKIVSSDELRETPHATNIHGMFVDAVIEAPFGAYPTSSFPDYVLDGYHFLAYTNAAASDDGYRKYLADVELPEADFRRRYCDPKHEAVLRAMIKHAKVIK